MLAEPVVFPSISCSSVHQLSQPAGTGFLHQRLIMLACGGSERIGGCPSVSNTHMRQKRLRWCAAHARTAQMHHTSLTAATR
jgi:hypothetical protein